MSEPTNDAPGRRAAKSPELPKRFYDAASVATVDGTCRVLLDGRPVRTPKSLVVEVYSHRLAQALCDEWAAQGTHIDPRTMPLTTLVNSALDGVVGNESAVIDAIAPFVASDLLSYRAQGPQELVQLQSRTWNPILHWAGEELGLGLVTTAGVMPVSQPDNAEPRARELLSSYDAFALSALHVLTTLSGSLVIALAVARGHLSVADAWAGAHVDEDYQISQWGADDEARTRRAYRRTQFDAAARLLQLL